MPRKSFFVLRYWLGDLPWDTGITPPEVLAFLANHPPGRVLDLGCGTGTNLITLAKHGWEGQGIDFVPRAIRTARRKARQTGVQDQLVFTAGNVLDPALYRGNFELILDMGCFHNLSDHEVEDYIKNITSHLSPGGSFLLYVHLARGGGPGHGASEESLALIGASLKLANRTDGEESSRPSAWLEFRK